jgi:hypothetical protein
MIIEIIFVSLLKLSEAIVAKIIKKKNMSKKIEIIGNSLVVTDTVTSKVILDLPKSEYYYKLDKLQDSGLICFYNIDLNDNLRSSPQKIKLSEAVDKDSVAFTEASLSSFCRINIGFRYGGSASLPTEDLFNGGFVDYNHSVTALTSLSQGTSPKVLVNDTLGTHTNRNYLPTGITDIWNTTTNRFDFSQLKLGDMLDIRLDLDIDTSLLNTNIKIDLHLAEGTAEEYVLPFLVETNYVAAKIYKINKYTGIYMGNEETLNSPSSLKISSDGACDFKVNGWYCKIIKRGS